MSEIQHGAIEAGINKALANIMTKIGAIAKGDYNKQQQYAYRGIDSVYNSLHDIFAEEGVITLPKVISRTRTDFKTSGGSIWSHVVLELAYTFMAKDGSSLEVGPIFSEGLDSFDKASMKALAHGHKYVLTQMFIIPTAEDKDPDGTTMPEEPKTQPPKPVAPKPALVKPSPVQPKLTIPNTDPASLDDFDLFKFGWDISPNTKTKGLTFSEYLEKHKASAMQYALHLHAQFKAKKNFEPGEKKFYEWALLKQLIYDEPEKK